METALHSLLVSDILDPISQDSRITSSFPRLVVMCSVCAAVQGMDETVVNGAQLFYEKQFSE